MSTHDDQPMDESADAKTKDPRKQPRLKGNNAPQESRGLDRPEHRAGEQKIDRSSRKASREPICRRAEKPTHGIAMRQGNAEHGCKSGEAVKEVMAGLDHGREVESERDRGRRNHECCEPLRELPRRPRHIAWNAERRPFGHLIEVPLAREGASG